MSKTKIQHITKAYKWLVISGITSAPSPEEIVDGLEVLEDMMHELRSRNICSAYVFEDEPSPSTDSLADDSLNTAIATNLAVRLANYFGKEPLPTLTRQATQSMSNWSARSGKTNQIDPPRRQPRGSGNTFRFSNWVRFYRFNDNAPIECDTFDLKVDAIDSFSVDFNNYLLLGATITSFEVEASNGIEVLTSAESEGIITLSCKGKNGGYQTVKLTVTTSTGRVNPEIVNFNITQ